jgi:hypothetical protein
MDGVIKESCIFKFNRDFLSNLFNCFRGIEQPIAIVLPAVNIISEILRLTITDGIDVNNVIGL